MTTVNDLAYSALNTWMLGTYRTRLNKLSGSIGASDEELTCAYGVGEVGKGSLVAIEDELAYVVDRNTTTNRLTLIRGVKGTTAAAHADGTAIEPNPRFPLYAVRAELKAEVESWPDDLYAVKQFSAATAASSRSIDIDSNAPAGWTARRVLRVRRGALDTTDDAWLGLRYGYDVAWDDEAAGSGRIVFRERLNSALNFRVVIGCDFKTATWTGSTDLQSDAGLATSMNDVAAIGCAWRLLGGRGAIRLDTSAQGESRDPNEVPPTTIIQHADWLHRLRQRRIGEEAKRLHARFGFGGQ